ncbi:MAG: hypothetical protein ABIP48_14490, partial [Planctomycetota bacterium]
LTRWRTKLGVFPLCPPKSGRRDRSAADSTVRLHRGFLFPFRLDSRGAPLDVRLLSAEVSAVFGLRAFALEGLLAVLARQVVHF